LYILLIGGLAIFMLINLPYPNSGSLEINSIRSQNDFCKSPHMLVGCSNEWGLQPLLKGLLWAATMNSGLNLQFEISRQS